MTYCLSPDDWGAVWQAMHNLVDVVAYLKGGVRDERYRSPEWDAHRALFRDVFGNPFRPVAFSPSWLTFAVVTLAEAVYADRAFDRLPILADALQDAGCEVDAILSHCRGPGPHVRGC